MKTLIDILKAALTKFSKVNMVQYIGIATLIIQSWQGASLISDSAVLLITGLLTLIFNIWKSSGELVSTGFNMDWSVWLMGLAGMVTGFLDTFITHGDILAYLFGDKANIAIMIYLALTIIFRTGFAKQSPESIAIRKAKNS